MPGLFNNDISTFKCFSIQYNNIFAKVTFLFMIQGDLRIYSRICFETEKRKPLLKST